MAVVLLRSSGRVEEWVLEFLSTDIAVFYSLYHLQKAKAESFVLRNPFLCFISASLVTALLLIPCDNNHYKCCSRLCCKLLSSKMTFIKVNNWNELWQLLISTITQSAHILAALGILNQSIIIDHGKWCSKVSIRCLCKWREGI